MWLLEAGPALAPAWTDVLQTGGVVAVLASGVIAFLRGWIVPGWVYSRAEAERDYYRELVHRGADLADRQTAVAETLTDRLLTEGRMRRQRAEDRVRAAEERHRFQRGRDWADDVDDDE